MRGAEAVEEVGEKVGDPTSRSPAIFPSARRATNASLTSTLSVARRRKKDIPSAYLGNEVGKGFPCVSARGAVATASVCKPPPGGPALSAKERMTAS